MKKKDNLVWMDLEFTGLSDEQIIIETACIITDKNLNILEEGPNIVVHRTSDELKNNRRLASKNTHRIRSA